MKFKLTKKQMIIAATVAWVCILTVILVPLIRHYQEEYGVVESIQQDGLLLNDDLVAIRGVDDKISFKDKTTGEFLAKGISIDWTSTNNNDSLAIYCSNDKRGYYNLYTGELVIEAQYRRAWHFSDGLAAVQKNGMIGFIDRKGRTRIDFKYPYHGNPLSSFIFKNGHCVVADTTGKCGVINKAGEWVILPEYDNVHAYKEYAIISKEGVRRQIDYDGNELNSFVVDDIRKLAFSEKERYENREGEIEYLDKMIDTGMFVYYVGGRCGLMDANCKRLTEPLYKRIRAVNMNMFRATLIDNYSEVILNAKGQVMN